MAVGNEFEPCRGSRCIRFSRSPFNSMIVRLSSARPIVLPPLTPTLGCTEPLQVRRAITREGPRWGIQPDFLEVMLRSERTSRCRWKAARTMLHALTRGLFDLDAPRERFAGTLYVVVGHALDAFDELHLCFLFGRIDRGGLRVGHSRSVTAPRGLEQMTP